MAEKKERVKIFTPLFRAAFVNVFSTAKPMKDSDPNKEQKYEITAIFTPAMFTQKDKDRFLAMKKIANDASMEKFKKPLTGLPANFHRPFRDGVEKEHLGGFGAGTIFAKLTSKFKPGIVGSDGKTIITDPGAIYAGCYCIATVNAYGFDNVSKGVKFGLQNLMFVRDGERLDNRSSADEDFEEEGLEAETVGADNDDLFGV